MNDPVQKWWSEEQLKDAAMEYMRVDFGLPEKDDKAARAEWFERLGILVMFAQWLWDCHTPRHDPPQATSACDASNLRNALAKDPIPWDSEGAKSGS